MTEHHQVMDCIEMTDRTLEAVFDRVASLVRSYPSEVKNNDRSSTETCVSTNEEKLRLYGLYKYVHDGRCGKDNEEPSCLQPVARAKYRSWKECSTLIATRNEAMKLYIQTVAARDDALGQESSRLWQKFCESINKKSAFGSVESDKNVADQAMTLLATAENEEPIAIDSAICSPKLSSNNRTHNQPLEDSLFDAINTMFDNDNSLLGRLLRFVGGYPLIPRGCLDISNADLWFAMKQCALSWQQSKHQHKKLKQEIADIWSRHTQEASNSVVVGLSVRSLFDLYLTHKGYKDQSEIIVIPPISVPGMMHVARFHNLRMVPVDIPLQDEKWVDIDHVKANITKQSVAIMLVHPFGMVTLDESTFAELRSLADQHGLEIWEDCAECFTGLGATSKERCYLGNPEHANIRFFSFGIIKTATALGGGVAILKDVQCAKHMDRLQSALYPTQQTTCQFFRRIVLAFTLNFIADSPTRVGLLAFVCRTFGFDFDSVVTYAVRGFRVVPQKRGDEDIQMIRYIRKQTCNASLALLQRRLKQSIIVAPSIPDRMRRCELVKSILSEHLPKNTFPQLKTFRNTFWAFPVCVHDRDRLSQSMHTLGFDVATGASQLCSVSSFICESGRRHDSSATDRLMDSILYLPITNQTLSDSCLTHLVKALQFVINNNSSDVPIRRSTSLQIPLVLVVIATGFLLGGWNFILKLFSWAISFITIWMGLQCLLRWTTADMYLNLCSAFIENCDMLGSKVQEEDVDKLSLMNVLNLSPEQIEGGRTVIITGATGFVGSSLLRDLLKNREILSLKRVVVICRAKGEASACQRVKKLMSTSTFNFMPKEDRANVIDVIEGNVVKENAGVSPTDLARICEDSTISHVFHCAAAVSFTQELRDAAMSNITSALNVQSLTACLSNKKAHFVHISTAFVHGDKNGSQKAPLSTETFCFEPFDPVEIYQSMLGTQYYASKAMMELGFHNTYSFSKSVCEHMLAIRNCISTTIIRPSIVGPAITAPFEGWAGDKPSTMVAGPCLHLSSQWNIWVLGPQHAPSIPVDVLARYILAKSFCAPRGSDVQNDTASSDGSFEHLSRTSDQCSDFEEMGSDGSSLTGNNQPLQIFNAAWNTNANPNSTFSWLEFSISYLQLGSVLGYFSRSSAMLQLLVSAQIMPMLICGNNGLFQFLHQVLIRSPLEFCVFLCDLIGIRAREIPKWLPFLDLPILFLPFMRNKFVFESEIVAPEWFDAKRYSFSCGVAAYKFISTRERASDPLRDLTSLRIGGASYRRGTSVWFWAFSQPKGPVAVRIVAVLVSWLLQLVCKVVTVDVTSFRNYIVVAKKMEGDATIVLAPTHRSFMDFILLSYVFFSLPEMLIDIPYVIASDEFEQIPVIGWLSSMLRAVYVQRGRDSIDRHLAVKLSNLKSKHPKACIEVFIEGTRSRDRLFVKPKTGLLKSLKESGGNHVIVPIAISYEGIPEQGILSEEAGGATRTTLNLPGMISWIQQAIKGDVNLGNIHIAAGDPIPMDSKTDTDFGDLVDRIQLEQQQQVVISDYHILAAVKLLNLTILEAERSIQNLGCRRWPNVKTGYLPELPNDTSCLLSIAFQFGHHLSSWFIGDRTEWAHFLNRLANESSKKAISLNSPFAHMHRGFLHLFDSARAIVDDGVAKLKGYGYENPSLDHLFQTCCRMNVGSVPLPLLYAAAAMKCPTSDSTELKLVFRDPSTLNQNTCASNEKLGFWGFHDSGFVVRIDRSGRRYVTMRGKRYALRGKPLRKLLPFMESSLRVKISLTNEFGLSSTTLSEDSKTDLSLTHQRFLLETLKGRVSFSLLERDRHGSGHSQEDVFHLRSGKLARRPDAVVWPTSEDELIQLVDAARTRAWCLIPFGGGTNVTNATACPDKTTEPRPIISVDMKKMNRILWLNEEDGLASVEAGIVGRDLVEMLENRGYTMGHEPDSIEFSTLGGWIATKASGMKRSKYGNVEDIVISTRLVGSNGVLWKENKCNEKAVSGRGAEGLDVNSFALGSEGCLGIISNAVIRIWPLPETRRYDSILFPMFHNGVNFLRMLSKQQSILPACIRLLDNNHFRLGQALRFETGSCFDVMKEFLAKLFLFKAFDPQSVVCVTICYEGTAREVREQMQGVASLALQHDGVTVGPKIGKAGYDLTYLIAYLRDFAMTYYILGESFETFAPWSKIESVVQATTDRIRHEHSLRLLPGEPFIACRVTQLYHEGACLYFYLCISFDGVKDGSRVYAELERAAREEVLKQGGSLSHHHGLGKLRASFVKERASSAFQHAMEAIKQGLDMDNIFGARNGFFAE